MSKEVALLWGVPPQRTQSTIWVDLWNGLPIQTWELGRSLQGQTWCHEAHFASHGRIFVDSVSHQSTSLSDRRQGFTFGKKLPTQVAARSFVECTPFFAICNIPMNFLRKATFGWQILTDTFSRCSPHLCCSSCWATSISNLQRGAVRMALPSQRSNFNRSMTSFLHRNSLVG